ncbi:MAG: endopeptidase La [Bacteroidaceae bacterium]|nr:endopeptidase La [Bacteroidaceae bacterium]
MNTQRQINPFGFIAEFEGNVIDFLNEGLLLPETKLPTLPLRDMVIYPGVIMPVSVARQTSQDVLRKALDERQLIGTVTQLRPEQNELDSTSFHRVGVAARVLKILDMPDGTLTAFVQGYTAFNVSRVSKDTRTVVARRRHESLPPPEDSFYRIIRETLAERVSEYIQLSDFIADEAVVGVRNAFSTPFFVNFIAANMPIDTALKIEILRVTNALDRATKLLQVVQKELQYAHLRADIQQKTKADIDDQQREYFLQQQLHNIQHELGNGMENDIAKMRKSAADKKWNTTTAETFATELDKLERLNPQSPDYQVQYNYLQTMLDLPWESYTTDNLSLDNAERVLNRNHYGMKDVKERILEHLAVRKLSGNTKRTSIICLYGPPGVGKTSLCRSIANALKRKYVRASLGGLHDEAEIRGHRRTYIGSMPGRIIKSLIKAGSSNPVFVLDEIDKISESNHNGDPASALLEVLDPEQNAAFHDNFLDIDYDLSNVMFICTANNVGAIPRPLLDRMELIEVNGYITEEKTEIARRHLIPRVKENCGLKDHKELKLGKTAIVSIIENYTRESGVRGLEKELDRFFRKMVLAYERTGTFPAESVTPDDIQAILGKPKYSRDSYQGNGFAGVVTGLAWTSVGGEILFIETSLSRGKGQKLTLTGNLGDVMKESAVLALEFIKAHADNLGIDIRIFEAYNIHIHVPEGAVPKDGPSAGITMATSLASALTQRKVRQNLAMTGEITLRGKVLPVGGIKEKILAAKRAGITDIILATDNRKDIDDIDDMYLSGLTFHYVDTVHEVLDFALLDEKVKYPISFRFDVLKDTEDQT